jgi:hypothetical protein
MSPASDLYPHSNGKNRANENRTKALIPVYKKDLSIVNGKYTVFR